MGRRMMAVGVMAALMMVLSGCGGMVSADQPTAAQPAPDLQEIKLKAITPAYDDLARYPERYIGQPIKFEGEVVQVVPDAPVVRLNVTLGDYGIYTNTVWVNLKTADRLLEKDIIQVYGLGRGEKTYTALMGNTIKVPQMDAYRVELVTKAGDRK